MSFESEIRKAFKELGHEQQNAIIDIARTYLFSTAVVTEMEEKEYDKEATDLWINYMFTNSSKFLLAKVGLIKEEAEAQVLLERVAAEIKRYASLKEEGEEEVNVEEN